MHTNDDLSRRLFLSGLLGGGALAVAGDSKHTKAQAAHRGQHQTHAKTAGPWSPAPVLRSPNILIIMVDQMRLPSSQWLTSSQLTTLDQTQLPNIFGRIQDNAYCFQQYFIAATNCSPARAAMLTGLYAPQTHLYSGDNLESQPALNPAFPTWATGLSLLNPAYKGNFWWFGKWHLSYQYSSTPLAPYGFNTRTYPGNAATNPSPNGFANEGVNGGVVTTPGPYLNQVFASDAEITTDFLGWLQGQAPTSGLPASPWCATVSLINPHDIAYAPAWLQTSPFPPTGVASQPFYFPPPTGTAPSLYSPTQVPQGWNWENLQTATTKPSFQLSYQTALAELFGATPPSSSQQFWNGFLNNYYWLQNFVDMQVDSILNALSTSPFANNTVIVFLSDHGEYGGAHGLHDKGGAFYDEGIRVPLCVKFPGQTGSVNMNQMCSAVDLFGLICDLGAGGNGQWRLAFPDLANRQSLWSFLASNSSETRIAPSPIGLPYILHTYDELRAGESGGTMNTAKYHIVGMRTKNDPTSGVVGAKLALYSTWANCATYPGTGQPDIEFYDYTSNILEMGNDYPSSPNYEQYSQALGTLGAPSTGLTATELNAPLVGKGTDNNPLGQAQSTALEAYLVEAYGSGSC
jgi:arylsulfatase A-like enzyme